MNLFSTLRYLVALDDHRHFGRAALACHITQPALSNALRALEQTFGTSIVRRERRFVGFTPEGERILEAARRILHEHETLQQDLASAATEPRGALAVGAVPTAMPIAARFVAQLHDRHPGIVPTLRSVSSSDLETGLETLKLDMGLGYAERMDLQHPHLRVVPQYVERYFLLSRADASGDPTPAAGLSAPGAGDVRQPGAPMRWADAAALPLCLLTPDMHNRTIVDRAFAAAAVSATPAIETNATVTLIASVAAGRVSSILPGALLEVMAGRDFVARALVEPTVEVPIAFLVHGSQRPSRTLEAALAFATDPEWLDDAARHSGGGMA
ncbi:MAG: LysR substrate-binding domain-containing protein [Burkholderiales bacterium]|nr:LysR substrate-binding domain-containing protein [Burkholderiales bacterium]